MAIQTQTLNKNEAGSALIWTLLISAIITVLALTLISFNVTQSKQNGKTETLIQEINLAEMGVLDFRNRIFTFLSTNPQSLQEIIDWTMGNFAGQSVEEFIPQTDNKYGYRVFNVQLEQPNNKQLRIKYESAGIIDDSLSDKKLSHIIDIVATGEGGGGGNNPISGDDSDWGPGEGGWDIFEPNNPETEHYDGNTVFQDHVLLGKKNKTNELTIEGHAKFEQNLDLSGYKGAVTIKEDGFFEGKTTLNHSETSISVGGNAKFSQDFEINGWSGTLTIGEDAIFESDVIFQRSEGSILINGGSLFLGNVELDGYSNNITVLKDAKFASSLTLYNHSYISVGEGPENACHANFDGPVNLSGYAVRISVGGDAHFGSTVTYVRKNADIVVEVGGAAVFSDKLDMQGFNGSLTVHGDAVFLLTPNITNQSYIIVHGDLYMDGSVPAGMQVYGQVYPTSSYEGSLAGNYSCTASGGTGWDISEDISY